MPLSEVQKSKHPCSVCAKRKVKCDRLVPCTNCVKRGFEEQCLERSSEGQSEFSSDFLPKVLRFWQEYEYWVADIGVFKCQDSNVSEDFTDLQESLDECEYWGGFLTRDQSFALLDYSMERLGTLYFGCLSDISELYLILEEYWHRRDEKNESGVIFSADDHYWDALLWSIFCLAVYYMPLEKLSTIFPDRPDHDLFRLEDRQKEVWTESLQLGLLACFERCTFTYLSRSNFTANPDIRLIQVYSILSSTTYPLTHISASNSTLLQCFHTAKIKHVNNFRPLIGDSTALRLTKITCEKMWYRLCICDYLQSSPNKPITFHTELSSLLQHAAYLEDLPTTDVYQSEDSFEVFEWKLLSLDRDLDQYLKKQIRPPLKTLDAVQRQLDIFSGKLGMHEESSLLGSDFAKFLVSYLLNTVSWKLHKMFLIYYGITDSLTKSVHYAKTLITLIVKNIKRRKNVIFNKHPSVIWTLSRVALFYGFFDIFASSADIQTLNLDITEVLQNLPTVFIPQLTKLRYLLSRFQLLREMWESVKVVDGRKSFSHPVVRILQNDIDAVSRRFNERPSMISGSGPLISRRETSKYEQSDENESAAFKLVVAEFESKYAIGPIIEARKISAES